MCSGRRYGSTDVRHDLFRSGHDLDLRSNFQNGLLRSNYSSYSSQEEKYDAGKMNAVSLLSQKLLQKTLVRKKRIFLEFLLSGGPTADLTVNLRTCWRKSVKKAIECTFTGRWSSSGSWGMCRFVEKNVENGKIWPLDLWWPDLWPDLKIDRSLSVIILTLFRLPLTARRYVAQEPS